MEQHEDRLSDSEAEAHAHRHRGAITTHAEEDDGTQGRTTHSTGSSSEKHTTVRGGKGGPPLVKRATHVERKTVVTTTKVDVTEQREGTRKTKSKHAHGTEESTPAGLHRIHSLPHTDSIPATEEEEMRETAGAAPAEGPHVHHRRHVRRETEKQTSGEGGEGGEEGNVITASLEDDLMGMADKIIEKLDKRMGKRTKRTVEGVEDEEDEGVERDEEEEEEEEEKRETPDAEKVTGERQTSSPPQYEVEEPRSSEGEEEEAVMPRRRGRPQHRPAPVEQETTDQRVTSQAEGPVITELELTERAHKTPGFLASTKVSVRREWGDGGAVRQKTVVMAVEEEIAPAACERGRRRHRAPEIHPPERLFRAENREESSQLEEPPPFTHTRSSPPRTRQRSRSESLQPLTEEREESESFEEFPEVLEEPSVQAPKGPRVAGPSHGKGPVTRQRAKAPPPERAPKRPRVVSPPLGEGRITRQRSRSLSLQPQSPPPAPPRRRSPPPPATPRITRSRGPVAGMGQPRPAQPPSEEREEEEREEEEREEEESEEHEEEEQREESETEKVVFRVPAVTYTQRKRPHPVPEEDRPLPRVSTRRRAVSPTPTLPKPAPPTPVTPSFRNEQPPPPPPPPQLQRRRRSPVPTPPTSEPERMPSPEAQLGGEPEIEMEVGSEKEGLGGQAEAGGAAAGVGLRKKTAAKTPGRVGGKTVPSKKPVKAAGVSGRLRKAKRHETFSSYVYKVLKQIHPNVGVSNMAMATLNSFCYDMFERFATEAMYLLRYHNRMTLTARDIATVTKLILPGELAKHAVVEGTRAVERYFQNVTAAREASSRGGKRRKGK
ncbi:histone H2B [Quaeritorhiza haematococci]|nr:histone H2B [Quaeritorhiza haematococci]